VTPNGTPSSLGFLQFGGSYKVNTDCTGTLTLTSTNANTTTGSTTGSSTSGSTTASNSSLTLNFILSQPMVPFTGAGVIPGASTSPIIQFNMSNSTETLFGFGQAQ